MSEEIKPKKERKFLKALGKIGEVLIQELFFRVGSNLIRKIGGKKPLPSILFIFLSLSLFAQFPNTGNKQRLGFQTTGDGLVWRGSLSDTASIQPINNQSAWVILDTVNLKMYSFDFTSNVWNFIGGAQGLTMPFDSIIFNTAKNGTVGVGEIEYNDTQGSLIQGLKGGNVTNVIGQQLHQRVNNRTGAPLAKGDVVYLAGSQGNRITVAKGLAVSDAFSANTFGVVAEAIANNQSGFIITEGLITGLNTSALTEDSAVYLSPTVAGGLTSTKPQAPQHTVYIGVCVTSSAGSGELFVKIRNGQELDELHDVRITSPVDRASLYYKSSEKLWRDTTAALLVSDTASMLTPYFRDADTTSLNLTSRFAAKLNISDTASMLTNYLRTGVAASTYLPLTGGTLSGDLGISKSSNSILRLSSADVGSYGKLIFSSNNGGYLNYGASIESSGDGVGVHVGSLNFLTGFGTVRTNRMTITPTGNLTIVNSATIGGTLGVTGNAAIGLTTASNKFHVNSENIGTGTSNWIAGNFGGLSGDRVVTGILKGKATIGGHNNTLDAWADLILNQDGGNVGINTGTPLFKLDVNGTTGLQGALTVNSSAVFNEGSTDSDFRVESDGNDHMVFVDASTNRVGIGYASPTKTLDVNGEVRINTVTATPTSLLGKDGSNVVGEVTTVAQTGLMTRGETTATTGSPSAIFTVTHGLGSTPTSVLVTSAGLAGAEKIIFEVYSKNSTTFSVQAWNYDGTEASSKSVKIFWLAIK